MGILVEIVVQSAEDAVAAEAGGAHRLELCIGLALGGLTPTIGLMRQVRRATKLPIMAMLRPRPSGFCYSPLEIQTMHADLDALMQEGADGFVVGVLNEERMVNADTCRSFVEAAQGRPVVFHRAFDATPDPIASLETLINVGYHRILTSGHAKTALEGADSLANLILKARNRIEILPGGGIRHHNVQEIVNRSGATQVHLAPTEEFVDPSLQGQPAQYGSHGAIAQSAVRIVMDAVTRLSLPNGT